MTPFIRDDFAAGGGWSQGLRLLGLAEYEVGVELEKNACATARAAGFKRWHTDVRGEPRTFGWPPLWGYIASPECQTFSSAGKGEGAKHLAAYIQALYLVASGALPEDAVRTVNDEALNLSAILSLEPMLVIRQHMPAWIALEQTPKVLPLWEAYARILAAWGYSVWTGILAAEQYGVPQTRRRAVLMASRIREVAPPVPTHSKFYSHDPKRLDPGVPKWVSMAEALGAAYADLSIRSNYGSGGDPAARGQRNGDEPAFTVTSHADRNLWLQRSRHSIEGVGRAERLLDEPSVTVGTMPHEWALLGHQKPDRASGEYQRRAVDEPAMTLTSGSRSALWVPTAAVEGDTDWVYERPSPTIVGSFAPDVVAAPGYQPAGSYSRQNMPGSVRVTPQEAAILQSFPADYPWQGSKSAQFTQIGNAVPPALAAAVIGALVGIPFEYRPVGA